MKKRKRFSNRGISIEMALLTLLVVFGLSLILLTVAELGVALNKRTQNETTARVEVSRAADTFSKSCSIGDEGYNAFDTEADEYTGYRLIKQNESEGAVKRYSLTICSSESNKILLYVVCDDSGRFLRYTNYGPEPPPPVEEPEEPEIPEDPEDPEDPGEPGEPGETKEPEIPPFLRPEE